MSEGKDKPLLVYFNGLGNGKPRLREALVMGNARAHGYKIVPARTDWYARESYSEQLAADIRLTRQLLGQTATMVLVGSSAGVSRAINVFGSLADYEDLLGVVGLCGRVSEGNLSGWDLRTLERMSRANKHVRAFPAFSQSVRRVDTTVNELPPGRLEDIVLMHHYADEVVPHQTQIIEGASSELVWPPGHALGVVAAGLMLPRVIDRHFLNHDPV